MTPSPLHCRARRWGSDRGNRGNGASGDGRWSNGRKAIVRTGHAYREHTRGTSTNRRSSRTVDAGRSTSGERRRRRGGVLERDSAASSSVIDDVAHNWLERCGRAMKLGQGHEVACGQEGEEVVADVGGWAGLVGELGLETLEEGRGNGDQVVAVGDEGAGDTGGVGTVGGGGRADDELVDTEAVGVGLGDRDGLVGGEEAVGIIERLRADSCQFQSTRKGGVLWEGSDH